MGNKQPLKMAGRDSLKWSGNNNDRYMMMMMMQIFQIIKNNFEIASYWLSAQTHKDNRIEKNKN